MPKIPKRSKTVLAFLQNMWFKDPDRMKTIYAKYVEREEPGKGRARFIRDFLFFGCLTGKRLRQAFGEDECMDFIWEEASPEMGGHSSSSFSHDPIHIADAIKLHQPKVVLVFGKIAQAGVVEAQAKSLIESSPPWQYLYGPHPAARHATVMNELHQMNDKLKEILYF